MHGVAISAALAPVVWEPASARCAPGPAARNSKRVAIAQRERGFEVFGNSERGIIEPRL